MKAYNNVQATAIETSMIDYILPRPVYYFLGLNNAGSSLKYVDLSIYNVSYPFLTEAERSFDDRAAAIFMEKNAWMAYPIIIGYASMILGLQRFMKNRPAYDLKYPLFLWNFVLAFLTIIGLTRSVPEIWFMARNYGLTSAICMSRNEIFTEKNGVLAFWGLFFVFSKVIELGDTVFLLLRKRKLIFLHWYHHATVLFYCWISYSHRISTGRLFSGMNGIVHSLMYSYFAVAALGVKIPRRVAMIITCFQLSQMVFGVSFNIWAYFVKRAGNECDVSYDNIRSSLLIYFSYVVLFSNFFVKAYINEFSPKKIEEEKLLNNNYKKVKST